MSYFSFWHLRETVVSFCFNFTPTTPSCTQESNTERLAPRCEEQPAETGRQTDRTAALSALTEYVHICRRGRQMGLKATDGKRIDSDINLLQLRRMGLRNVIETLRQVIQ